MLKRRFLVIGIGQLGESLTRHLYGEGLEVIALDTDAAHIDAIKGACTLAIVGDSSDQDVLVEAGAARVDVALICMGTSLEASVLTLTHLLEMKIPHIAVRAANRKLAEIFKKMGAHEVFFVEEEVGKLLAQKYSRPNILHSMELGLDLKLVEWIPPNWAIGKSLRELNLPMEFNVQILAFRSKANPKLVVHPSAELKIESHLLALIMGTERDLQRLIDRE
jgi:trk system potassium uptake protein